MAKDPAFLFYSSDFLNGVSDLTMEERGQYITLLCLQHQKDELTEKTIRLSLGSVSVDVLSKFVKNENGNYFNERLCDEIEKRKLFTESRRNNGAKGGRPKNKLKPNGLAKKNLMEDVNENEDESLNKGEKIEKLQIPENFIKVWCNWIEYRKAKKIKNYAGLKYEQMALQKLIDYSKSDPKIAEKIILESITNSWTGFFELKNLNNNQNGIGKTNQKLMTYDD
jgi:uncharacterized protein YdaU (DUF1376 family)